MRLAGAGIWYRFSSNATMRALSLERMSNLDALYGLPTGMFNGDEWLPDPPTRNPSRGIETCGVVEAMFSYTCLGATIGDVSFFDRAERIAFNALPAAWASPRESRRPLYVECQNVTAAQKPLQPRVSAALDLRCGRR